MSYQLGIDFGTTFTAAAVRRAFALYERPADWRRVRATGMRRSADWAGPATQYADVYRQALAA